MLPVALRALVLAAMALIGNAYLAAAPRAHRGQQQPAARSCLGIFWGQIAALWARWAIVLGGAALVLTQAGDPFQLAVEILPVVVLLIPNLYLHGRYLVERPANSTLTLLASGIDLAMLGTLFFTWQGAVGLDNPTFLLLYPLIFSVGLIFAPRISWPFTAVCLGAYSVLALPFAQSGDVKVLVVRLLTMVAVWRPGQSVLAQRAASRGGGGGREWESRRGLASCSRQLSGLVRSAQRLRSNRRRC